MKGLLIYNREDYDKNSGYAEWLIDTFRENGVALELIFSDYILIEGLRSIEEIDFVINRSRSYNISILFELNGVRVFNNSEITLLGNNKLAAYRYANKKGYKYPQVLLDWLHKDGDTVISKTTDGHGGSDVMTLDELGVCGEDNRFQQERLDIIGDIRFYVIDNKIIHAILRSSSDKITSNFSQGGNIKIYNYSRDEETYISKFIEGLDIDYAGVDFFLDKKGKLIFNEIEDVVGSRMLSYLGINNTVELYVEHILNKIGFKE